MPMLISVPRFAENPSTVSPPQTIVVAITGGMGNQLFCYASGRGIATTLGATLRFHRSKNLSQGDRTYRLDRFRADVVHANLWQKAMIRLSMEQGIQRIGAALNPIVGHRTFEIVQDAGTGYSPAVLRRDRSMFLRGFWQSERYFAHISDDIRAELEMVDPPREIDRPIVEKMRSTESVCVHIRRGDLVSNPEYASKICVQDAAYYSKAADRLKQPGRDLHFFVFSDDPDWPRENLSLGRNVDFLCGPGAHGREDWQDFQLMRECKHFITANSTFSWWAAWLGCHPDKQVIAPRLWYRNSDQPPSDLIPSQWTIL
jgi:hypothetical protein